MILIKNTQKKIKINESKIKSKINLILKKLGYSNFDLSIWFTTNQTIRKFNKKFREKNKPTDILSFPFHENIKPGQKIKISNPEDKVLGDIIISLEYCKKDAQNSNLNFSDYLLRIIIHGIAHLLGFDHQTNEQFKKMNIFENKLLKLLNIKMP
ncbi:rRNA maturation RNase YbeY [Candidatus Dependentiae bacterium]|nr:rRNA maturation RNase YbeY [Candidatus Dependentiae bacterium]